MEGEGDAIDLAKTLLGLMRAAVEQVTVDSGSWTLAAQCARLPVDAHLEGPRHSLTPENIARVPY